MSEHTPLTEAEWADVRRSLPDRNYGQVDVFQLADTIERILAARTSTATAATGHKAGCQEFPTGWLCVSDCTTVWHDKSADLRERLEALADEWEGWAKNRSTARIDAFRDAAEYLRDALATPASTEDRADNEGTR